MGKMTETVEGSQAQGVESDTNLIERPRRVRPDDGAPRRGIHVGDCLTQCLEGTRFRKCSNGLSGVVPANVETRDVAVFAKLCRIFVVA